MSLARVGPLLALLCLAAAPARADEGAGPTAAAYLGWPGSGVEVGAPLGDRARFAARAEALAGSPVMGHAVGLGGRVSLSMQARLPNPAALPLVLRVEPWAARGDASLFGEPEPADEGVGYCFGVDTQGLFEWTLTEGLSLSAGVGIAAGAATTPDGPAGARGFATFTALLGLRARLRPRLLLVGALEAGGGVAAPETFEGHAILRLRLGLLYAPGHH